MEHGYALVRGSNNEITGIVTNTDLAEKLNSLTEPFALLSQIENHIRDLIARGEFSAEELARALHAPIERPVTALHNLTLGEYQRLLQAEEYWVRVNLPVDRTKFLADLDKVRSLRNAIVHFDPDSPTESDLKTLRRFTAFLDILRNKVGL
jgi:hypothetical protein